MNIPELIGKTFSSVVNDRDEELRFTGNKTYTFYHEQHCCEEVVITDICGDLSDLENSKILSASVESNSEENDDGSTTWTFYKYSTIKGSVTVRWTGSSNGYYSEAVHFCEVIKSEAQKVKKLGAPRKLKKDLKIRYSIRLKKSWRNLLIKKHGSIQKAIEFLVEITEK